MLINWINHLYTGILQWVVDIKAGRKFYCCFFFFFSLWFVFFPSRSCHCPLLPIPLPRQRAVYYRPHGGCCRIACDELNWQNSLLTTRDVHDLNHWVWVAVLDCSIKLSPWSLRTSGINSGAQCWKYRKLWVKVSKPSGRWGSCSSLGGVAEGSELA